MGSNERLPDRDDPRLYPPLHSTSPQYAPELVDTRLAAKQEKIRRAAKIFTKYQAAQSVKRADEQLEKAKQREAARSKFRDNQQLKLTYEDNTTGYGWMVRGAETPKLVEHNADNDHFFTYDARTKNFELAYHGSADIVSFLEMHLAVDKVLRDESPTYQPRPLAFFDKKGHFHNQVLPQRLDEQLHDISGDLRPRHTAIFTMPHNGRRYESVVAIDDIRCLSLAKPADGQSAAEKLPDNI